MIKQIRKFRSRRSSRGCELVYLLKPVVGVGVVDLEVEVGCRSLVGRFN